MLQGLLEWLSVTALIEWGTYFMWVRQYYVKIGASGCYFHIILWPWAASLRGLCFYMTMGPDTIQEKIPDRVN